MTTKTRNKIPLDLFADIYHEYAGIQKEILKVLDMSVQEFEVMMAEMKSLGYHLSSEQRNRIVPDREVLLSYVELKKSDVEISRIHDCNSSDVRQWYRIYGIKKANFSPNRGNANIDSLYPTGTEEEVKETKAIIQGFLDARPLADLAKQCDVSETIMRKFVKKLGVNTTFAHKFSEETPSLKELYVMFVKKKMTLDAVAQSCGVSVTQARRWKENILSYEKKIRKLM